jgi:tRNA G10  N-methylase Trm11
MGEVAVGHPAKFSDPILDVIAGVMAAEVKAGAYCLDPMAGTGKVAAYIPGYTWICRDIEEWPDLVFPVGHGDATAMEFPDESFEAVVTSPTYGNRMADHHNAKDASRRISYKFNLGRELHPNNTGDAYFPSPKYNRLHIKAWREVHRVLKVDGIFILNVKNFIKGGEVVDVCSWHKKRVVGMGTMELVDARRVPVDGLRFGANREARVDHEMVYVFRKLAF